MKNNQDNTLYVMIDETQFCNRDYLSYGADFFFDKKNEKKVLIFQNSNNKKKQSQNLFSDENIQKIIDTGNNKNFDKIKIFDYSHAASPELLEISEKKTSPGITKEDIKDKNITGWIRQEHPIEHRTKIIKQLLNKYKNVKTIEIHSTACFCSYRQKSDNGNEINYIYELQKILKDNNSNVNIILKLSPIQDECTSVCTVIDTKTNKEEPYIIYGLNRIYKKNDFPYLIQPDVHISKNNIDIKYNKFVKDEYLSSFIKMDDHIHYYCGAKPLEKNYKPKEEDEGLYLNKHWINDMDREDTKNNKASSRYIQMKNTLSIQNTASTCPCDCNCFDI